SLSAALKNLAEFVEHRPRRLLLIEDNDVQRKAIVDLIGDGDVETTAVDTGSAALEAIARTKFDCLVLDLGLPDMDGFELIERIKHQPHHSNLPIIVYTGKELTPEQEQRLRQLAETVIIKDARSPERLLDQTALFLHRVEAQLPE